MALSYIDDVSILKTTTMTQDTDDPVILTAMESLTEGTINTSTTKSVSNADAKMDGYETLGGFIGLPEKRAAFIKSAADRMARQIRALDPLRKRASKHN